MTFSAPNLQHYSHYRDQILSVRRNYHPDKGWAPNKPIFILSLITYFDQFEPISNEIIPIDLYSIFVDKWDLLTNKEWDPRNFSYPAYHLQSDGLWLLKDKQGRQPNKVVGKRKFEEGAFIGILDNGLFQLLTDPSIRQVLRLEILEAFFPSHENSYLETFPTEYKALLWELEAEILEEKPARIGKIKKEYEGFLRAASFRRAVLKVYNRRCTISGFGVIGGAPIVEAAHIHQFSISGDNSIHNGLALTPTLHRAFDRGYISISDNYRVLIHPSVMEHPSSFALNQFRDKQLFLPEFPAYYPGKHNFKKHREQWGFPIR
jgi:putative restriction endonuclease